MSGKRRRAYAVRKTVGWHVNPETGKSVQEQITIGYAATRAEGLQILAEYNNNPFDIKAFCVKPQDIVVYHFRILSPRILTCQCFVTKAKRKPRKTEVFRGKG